LKCFYHEKVNFLFNFFLSKGNSHCKFLALNLDSYEWFDPKTFNYHIMYDFIWTINPTEENKYPLTGITYDNSLLKIEAFLFSVRNKYIGYGSNYPKGLLNTIYYSNQIGYFDIYNNNFYFIGYQSKNLLFKTGYYNGTNKIGYKNIYKFTFILNDKNPLKEIFDKSVIIKNMRFIKHTKYIYYKIYDEKENIFYHGIIDIILNKVIFNTNEEIIEFKPYRNNSMLAITKNSAFKICAIKGNNDNCIDECPEGKIIYDLSKPNQCEIKKEDQEEQKEKEREREKEKEKEREKEKEKERQKEKEINKENNENKERDTNLYSILMIIIMILIIIIISMLAFFFYKKFKKRPKENEILNKIYNGLEDNNEKLKD